MTQSALEDKLAADDNSAWIDQVRSRPPRLTGPADVGKVLNEVREGFGA